MPITRMPTEPKSIEPEVVAVQPVKYYEDASQQMYEILSSRSHTMSAQDEPSETSIISKPTARILPSVHEASVQMSLPTKNNMSIQLDYVPNAVNFRVVEKSIVTQSARPSMDDEICFKELSRRTARGKDYDERIREKEAELYSIKKLIR